MRTDATKTRSPLKLADVQEYIECADSQRTLSEHAKKLLLTRWQLIMWRTQSNNYIMGEATSMWEDAKLDRRVYKERAGDELLVAVALPIEFDAAHSVSRKRHLQKRIGMSSADEGIFHERLHRLAKPAQSQQLSNAFRASLGDLAGGIRDDDSNDEMVNKRTRKASTRHPASRRKSPPPSIPEKARRPTSSIGDSSGSDSGPLS